jgi:hypothetical protein
MATDIRPIFLTLLITVATSAATTSVASAAAWKPELLPRSQETSEALAACPTLIRGEAVVYLLTETGYELVRPSQNGFNSIIGRTQPDSFEPQCLDAEGSSTLLHQILMRGRLQMQGLSREEILEQIETAWSRGDLQAPSRPGINYMLSERNRVPIGPETVIPYQPHVMFDAPHLTNTDLGGSMQGESPIFVINEGSPDAYVIVPISTDEGNAHSGAP